MEKQQLMKDMVTTAWALEILSKEFSKRIQALATANREHVERLAVQRGFNLAKLKGETIKEIPIGVDDWNDANAVWNKVVLW